MWCSAATKLAVADAAPALPLLHHSLGSLPQQLTVRAAACRRSSSGSMRGSVAAAPNTATQRATRYLAPHAVQQHADAESPLCKTVPWPEQPRTADAEHTLPARPPVRHAVWSDPLATAGQPVAEDRSTRDTDGPRLSDSFSVPGPMHMAHASGALSAQPEGQQWQQPHAGRVRSAMQLSLAQPPGAGHGREAVTAEMLSGCVQGTDSDGIGGAEATMLTDTSVQCLPPDRSTALPSQRFDGIAAVRSELQGLRSPGTGSQRVPAKSAETSRHSCQRATTSADRQVACATDAHCQRVQQQGSTASSHAVDTECLHPLSQGSNAEVHNPTHSTLLREFHRLEQLMHQL